MKSSIKRIIVVAVTILACMSFVMMTAEAETISLQVLLTGGSAAVFYACYKILDRMGVFNEEERDVEI